jgi:hypothetical protein
MLLHALRRLVGLAIAFAIMSTVANNLGPGLAARSMNGFMAEMDAAQSGDYAKADAISSDLARQWQHLQDEVVLVMKQAEHAVSELAR